MILTLERSVISRKPGIPRSIRLLIASAQLPELRPANQQPVRTTAQSY